MLDRGSASTLDRTELAAVTRDRTAGDGQVLVSIDLSDLPGCPVGRKASLEFSGDQRAGDLALAPQAMRVAASQRPSLPYASGRAASQFLHLHGDAGMPFITGDLDVVGRMRHRVDPGVDHRTQDLRTLGAGRPAAATSSRSCGWRRRSTAWRGGWDWTARSGPTRPGNRCLCATADEDFAKNGQYRTKIPRSRQKNH